MELGPSQEYIWAPHTKHRGAEPQTLNIYASDVLFWLVSHPNNQGCCRLPYVQTTGRYGVVGMSPWSFYANPSPVKDLNYRLNLPDADVRSLVCSVPTSRAIRTLLQFDEVRLLTTAVDACS